ncbi:MULTISPECIES: GAF domain-containing protein [unclassified Streptomyces]|uniref:GAF domain-containing protein n=1 Tax=unclassified Streptomyces TaxID=2593676 RepID=UPI0035DEA410
MTPRTEPASASGSAAETVPPVDPHRRELLQSIVDVARAIFGAEASSVFLLDEETDELVFQAVSGQGEEFLVGRRFPAGRGIAGWVATSGEPMVVDDLTTDTSFDRSLAESTEFVPDSLMAAPLISDGRVLGVLEVLDPSPRARTDMRELDLLAMFARQAAAALRMASYAPAAAGAQGGGDRLGPRQRADALRLLGSLEQLLREPC